MTQGRTIKLSEDFVTNLAEFIYESDLIEDIVDDPDLLMRQIRAQKKDGHVGAMLMLERLVLDAGNRGDLYIEKQTICEVQKLIVAEQNEPLPAASSGVSGWAPLQDVSAPPTHSHSVLHPRSKLRGIADVCNKKPGGHKLPDKWIGEFRDCDVTVGNTSCPTSDQIPHLMDALLQRVRSWQKRAKLWHQWQNLNEIARFHFEFEIIHPFADGNGRTGRALAYYMMRYAGLKPFAFTNFDKHELYYPCFVDSKNDRLMRGYFLIKIGSDFSKLFYS